MDSNYDVISLFQNTFILRRPRVDILPIFVAMFIKKVFKASRISNYVSKCKLDILDIAKFANFRSKMLMSADFRMCVT